MTLKLLSAAIVALALSVNTADAQTVKGKAQNQRQRIKQGVKTGELTKAETRNVVSDQREIRQDVKAAKSDGTVTKEERKDIKQDQRQASRKIYRKKHNNRDRN
jgi:uncharacterized membrane protein YebE (DUF533 family)